jgi:hypothetical protein
MKKEHEKENKRKQLSEEGKEIGDSGKTEKIDHSHYADDDESLVRVVYLDQAHPDVRDDKPHSSV